MKHVSNAVPDAVQIFNGILAIIRTMSKSLNAISMIAFLLFNWKTGVFIELKFCFHWELKKSIPFFTYRIELIISICCVRCNWHVFFFFLKISMFVQRFGLFYFNSKYIVVRNGLRHNTISIDIRLCYTHNQLIYQLLSSQWSRWQFVCFTLKISNRYINMWHLNV